MRSINLSSATISSPIISGVTQFDLYGTDGFSFVAIENDQKTVGVWKKGWKKPFIVDRFNKNQLSLIRFSRYFNKDTVVVSNDGKVVIYRCEVLDDKSKQAEFLLQKTTLLLERSRRCQGIAPEGRCTSRLVARAARTKLRFNFSNTNSRV